MFSIGDLVVHPMHGAGMIDDIVQEKIAGELKEYYVSRGGSLPLGGYSFIAGGSDCKLEQALSGESCAAEKRKPPRGCECGQIPDVQRAG